jgi:NAD(P)H dehydrogenase (quinone)
MKVFVVYWHPEPQSFNHAMLTEAARALGEAGAEVRVSDLREMAFDPVSDRRNFVSLKDPDYLKPQMEELHATEVNGFAPEIEAELQKLEWCDLMIWQFPLWWFGLPAVLKGWVDRVFAMGRTYGGGRMYEAGMFRGKRALLSLTTGGPEATYLPEGLNGDLHGILRPIQRGMLQFVGFDVLVPHVVYAPARMSDDERRQSLERYARRLAEIRGERPIEVGHY